MEKVRTYAEAQEEFIKHGFSFTAESMKFLLEHKKSFSEIADMSNEENCVYMVAAAIPSHDRNEAIDVIYSFSRTVEHNNTYIDKVYNSMKEAGYDTIAYLTIMVK